MACLSTIGAENIPRSDEQANRSASKPPYPVREPIDMTQPEFSSDGETTQEYCFPKNSSYGTPSTRSLLHSVDMKAPLLYSYSSGVLRAYYFYQNI
jgi:hypothetical protein